MIRIGIDIGGSKIAAIALDQRGREVARLRRDVPRAYDACLAALVGLSERLQQHGPASAIGIGMPGLIDAHGTLVRVVNLPWLQGRALQRELQEAVRCPMQITNDANCFALSEAVDGAAAGARVVFGAILGTGVGGGIVIEGKPLVGSNAIAGEWGHNPLAGTDAADGPPVLCGCGRSGCIEPWLNGAALARDYQRISGGEHSAAAIARVAEDGDLAARHAIARYQRRLARGLAGIINVLDPDVIVLGGGLSSIASLYAEVPQLWAPLVLAAQPQTRLVPARFGPESGLRGAAWLGRRKHPQRYEPGAVPGVLFRLCRVRIPDVAVETPYAVVGALPNDDVLATNGSALAVRAWRTQSHGANFIGEIARLDYLDRLEIGVGQSGIDRSLPERRDRRLAVDALGAWRKQGGLLGIELGDRLAITGIEGGLPSDGGLLDRCLGILGLDWICAEHQRQRRNHDKSRHQFSLLAQCGSMRSTVPDTSTTGKQSKRSAPGRPGCFASWVTGAD